MAETKQRYVGIMAAFARRIQVGTFIPDNPFTVELTPAEKEKVVAAMAAHRMETQREKAEKKLTEEKTADDRMEVLEETLQEVLRRLDRPPPEPVRDREPEPPREEEYVLREEHVRAPKQLVGVGQIWESTHHVHRGQGAHRFLEIIEVLNDEVRTFVIGGVKRNQTLEIGTLLTQWRLVERAEPPGREVPEEPRKKGSNGVVKREKLTGGAIREARTAAGMTARGLSQAVGCALTHISDLENGKRVVKPWIEEKLRDVLDLKP